MELLIVYFENLVYNISIKLKELIKWGGNLTWIKIQFLLLREYFFSSPYSIIKKYGDGSENFIYGETPLLTVDRILCDAGITQDDTLIDLGCGRGLMLFGAYLSKDIKATGIDIVEPFIEKGNRIASALKTDKVRFKKIDINDYDFSLGNIFFIAGTTFEDDVLKKITKKISQIKGNVKIISLSQKIDNEHFPVILKRKYQFSWGDNLVYIQEKTGIIEKK